MDMVSTYFPRSGEFIKWIAMEEIWTNAAPWLSHLLSRSRSPTATSTCRGAQHWQEHIQEVKALANPPAGVRLACEGVCIMLLVCSWMLGNCDMRPNNWLLQCICTMSGHEMPCFCLHWPSSSYIDNTCFGILTLCQGSTMHAIWWCWIR